MTKSDHELIKFAAGKLNVEVHVGAAYDGKKIWYEAPTAICAINIHHHNGTPFDLTSPELFLKGLVECPFEVIVFKNRVTDDTPSHIQILDDARDKMAIKRFNEAHEIALLFWQCWAELEGWKG